MRRYFAVRRYFASKLPVHSNAQQGPMTGLNRVEGTVSHPVWWAHGTCSRAGGTVWPGSLDTSTKEGKAQCVNNQHFCGLWPVRHVSVTQLVVAAMCLCVSVWLRAQGDLASVPDLKCRRGSRPPSNTLRPLNTKPNWLLR